MSKPYMTPPRVNQAQPPAPQQSHAAPVPEQRAQAPEATAETRYAVARDRVVPTARGLAASSELLRVGDFPDFEATVQRLLRKGAVVRL
jgi:hypothetical protein